MRLYGLKYLAALFVAGICLLSETFAQQLPAKNAVPGDSMITSLPDKMNTVGRKTGDEVKQLPAMAKQSAMQLIAPEKKLMDSLLAAGKSVTQTILAPVNLFKKGSVFFRINNISADVQYTYLHDTSGLSTGILQNLHSTVGYDLRLQLTIANMPFDARVAGSNGLYSIDNTSFTDFPQFNFNHKAYLGILQRQVLEKIKPEKVLSSVLSRINAIKSQYEGNLKNEIQKIRQEFVTEFRSELDLPSNFSDLSVNDLANLKRTIIPQEALESYKRGSEIYQELNSFNGDNFLLNDSLKRRALQGIKKYEALEKIYSKIIGWKEKFDHNPLVKELREHLPFTPGNYKSYIKNPSNLVDIVKQYGNLQGIQRLFLNITKLDVGVNPLSGGELNLENVVNNGINAAFTNKRSSIGIIYGSGNKNVNQWMQAGLKSFESNEYSQLTGFNFGSGWNSRVKQSISLNFFDFNSLQGSSNIDPTMLQPGYVSRAARRDAIITWQSSLDIAPGHKISVDLSKSLGSYRNSLLEDSSSTKANAYNDIFSGAGKANYAAALDYDGVVFNTDVQLTLKKAGLGYNNPGNIFIRRGESRVGLGISRKFLKQRVSVKYKTDFRSQHFDPSKRYTYTNYSNNLQLGYRVKRNTRFGVAVRHNSYRFDNDASLTKLHGNSFNLQGDGSYLFRIKAKKVINNFSLARQRFDMPMLTGDQYRNNTWLITHTSSLVLNKNLMSFSLLVNESDNNTYYFNTSFINTELNYTYSAGEKIRFTSGLGFYSNTGWNQQVGLKQQLSGTVFKRLQIDIDATWKKAVRTIRPELANQVYISSSIHYAF